MMKHANTGCDLLDQDAISYAIARCFRDAILVCLKIVQGLKYLLAKMTLGSAKSRDVLLPERETREDGVGTRSAFHNDRPS